MLRDISGILCEEHLTKGIPSFIEHSPVMRLDGKNKQEEDHAHCTECQNVGCGGSALLILDLLCVFIVILILDLVLWVCLLLRSHHNNTGCRVIFFLSCQILYLTLQNVSVELKKYVNTESIHV